MIYWKINFVKKRFEKVFFSNTENSNWESLFEAQTRPKMFSEMFLFWGSQNLKQRIWESFEKAHKFIKNCFQMRLFSKVLNLSTTILGISPKHKQQEDHWVIWRTWSLLKKNYLQPENNSSEKKKTSERFSTITIFEFIILLEHVMRVGLVNPIFLVQPFAAMRRCLVVCKISSTWTQEKKRVNEKINKHLVNKLQYGVKRSEQLLGVMGSRM